MAASKGPPSCDVVLSQCGEFITRMNNLLKSHQSVLLEDICGVKFSKLALAMEIWRAEVHANHIPTQSFTPLQNVDQEILDYLSQAFSLALGEVAHIEDEFNKASGPAVVTSK